MNFSSAFNTIIPNLFLPKLTQLSVPTSNCQWINSFLTDRQQLVRLGKFSSSTCTISTGAPQGCVLSPLLFSLYTKDFTSKDPSVKLLKFPDNTTLIGLILDGDESAYRRLRSWLSGAVLTAWSWTRSEQWRSSWTSREPPPALLPTYHHEQHCDWSGVIQVPGCHHLLGPEVGQSHRLHCEKGQLRKFNLPQELLEQF